MYHLPKKNKNRIVYKVQKAYEHVSFSAVYDLVIKDKSDILQPAISAISSTILVNL